jgi:phosphohistidine phosphatase
LNNKAYENAFLIRHAKSDWPINVQILIDHLTKEVRKMHLKWRIFENLGVRIDSFVTSPAKRALTTCKYFAEVFENENITKIEKLYDASSSDFLEVIENLSDEIENVAIFSHNNGITYFANSLTNENIVHLPTCAVVGFKIETENWQDFKNSKKNFYFFILQKKFSD